MKKKPSKAAPKAEPAKAAEKPAVSSTSLLSQAMDKPPVLCQDMSGGNK